MRRPTVESRYSWTPYEPNDSLNSRWWNSASYMLDDPLFVQVLQDDREVAESDWTKTFRGASTSERLNWAKKRWRSSSSKWPRLTDIEASGVRL